MCCFKRLNEVLLDWNNSEEDIQDNSIIKSSDIKKKIDNCFIYEVAGKPHKIKIFGNISKDFFSDNTIPDVYINGKHVNIYHIGERYLEANIWGWYTTEIYNSDTYAVDIDLSKLIIAHYLFYGCHDLIKVPLLDINSKVRNFRQMFCNCINLETVPLFNFGKFSKIETMEEMFRECVSLNNETKAAWSDIYDFDSQRSVREDAWY